MAEKRLGVHVASKLRARLADLRAAETVADLVVGHRKVVEGSPAGVSLGLGDATALYCTVNQDPIPREAGGGVNWARVHRLLVVKIGEAV